MTFDVNDITSENGMSLQSRAGRSLTAAKRLRLAATQTELDERRAALRALLRRPILPAAGETADAYRLVWRHADYLRQWLTRMTGWTLVLQGELARLRKTPNGCDDATRAALDRNKQPLTRQRYAIVCLLLAVLEGEERQTTLRQVAQRASLLAGADTRLRERGLLFDLTSQDCRRDLVCGIHLLVDLGVMARDDGDDQEFIRGTGDALYRIHRPVLASLLCVSRAPSTLPQMHWPERLEALHQRELPDSDEARVRALRHQLVRRMLEQPVLYFDQLSEQELAYLQSQRAFLLGEIEEATGLTPEIRGEGIALLDEIGNLSDIGLPEAGTLGHATLLLAQWLTQHLQAETAGIQFEAIDVRMAELAAEHREHWKRGVEQPAVRAELTRDVLHRLEALGLVELRRGQVLPRPAIARYALKDNA